MSYLSQLLGIAERDGAGVISFSNTAEAPSAPPASFSNTAEAPSAPPATATYGDFAKEDMKGYGEGGGDNRAMTIIVVGSIALVGAYSAYRWLK